MVYIKENIKIFSALRVREWLRPVFHLALPNMAQHHVALHERHLPLHEGHVAPLIFRQ